MAKGNPPKDSRQDKADRTELGARAHGSLRGENASPEHTRARVWLRGQAAESKANTRRNGQ